MPRARNTSTSPEADALDAAAKAFARLERQIEEARALLQGSAVDAIRSGMSVAEAARRAGYTREYMSKVYAMAQRESQEREQGAG